jgi:hypothetical protein
VRDVRARRGGLARPVRPVRDAILGLVAPLEHGSTSAEEYDALIVSTGVTNGFWRRPHLQSADEIGADLRAAHDRLAAAQSVIVAATDPLRSSARNRADGLLTHNVLATFAGRPLKTFRAPKRRWGSVIGIQPDGLEVFAPNGRAFRFPAWSFDSVLMPLIVRWGIYRGVRDNRPAL